MGLSKYRLGDLIELLEQANTDLQYGIKDVRGVNNLKKIMPTKSDLNGRDLSKFQIVHPGEFFFNHRTSRNGAKFSITYNYESAPIVCTEDYVVFKIKSGCERILIKEWLYMFFNRSEFDRYVITNSWGSSTEFYNWVDICSIELELPDYITQKKYVDIYNAMLANQKSYERGLDDLKLVCDAYIEELRREIPCEPIGSYIVPVDVRNTTLEIKKAQGITIEKIFADPKQVADAERNAKVVKTGQFAYNRATTRNGEKISIAYREDEDCVVSSAYQVFEINKKDKLLPEYLMMWFKRSEFDRYARYMSKGSAHEFFEYADMEEVEIPIPQINIQQSIVNIYKTYMSRRIINNQLKEKIKDICPILIKGSIEEARGTKEA